MACASCWPQYFDKWTRVLAAMFNENLLLPKYFDLILAEFYDKPLAYLEFLNPLPSVKIILCPPLSSMQLPE